MGLGATLLDPFVICDNRTGGSAVRAHRCRDLFTFSKILTPVLHGSYTSNCTLPSTPASCAVCVILHLLPFLPKPTSCLNMPLFSPISQPFNGILFADFEGVHPASNVVTKEAIPVLCELIGHRDVSVYLIQDNPHDAGLLSHPLLTWHLARVTAISTPFPLVLEINDDSRLTWSSASAIGRYQPTSGRSSPMLSSQPSRRAAVRTDVGRVSDRAI